MNYAKKLQAIQKMSGQTQQELAGIFGVSFPTLNSWINGKSHPRQEHLMAIDSLYAEYTGETKYSSEIFQIRQQDLKELQKKHSNPLRTILSRKDLYDTFLLELTYHTNSIEGSTLNEPEVRAVLFDNVTIPNKSVIEHQEAKNHQGAFAHVMRWLGQGSKKIDENLILRLHEILMNGILHNAGQYRNHSVRIAGSHVPTTYHLKIKEIMKTFIKEVNKVNKDPVQHIAETHALFGKIHPFSDGNGRIGRLIMSILALMRGLPPIVIKQQKKRAYYAYLEKAQLHEDSSQFVLFVHEALITAYNLF